MARKILVLNGWSYSKAVDAIAEVDDDHTAFFKHTKDFDMVLFTGGADISPSIYDDTSPDNYCYCNPNRDEHEVKVFLHALRNGIKMAGICRGLQLLNCLGGGKMIHHLDNHGGTFHKMITSTGEEMIVNSIHHQAILPSKEAIVVGVSKERLSEKYIGKEDRIFDYTGPEIEAAIFPTQGSFGVQYHPEMMSKDLRGHTFFSEMVEAALMLSWERFVERYTRIEAEAANA